MTDCVTQQLPGIEGRELEIARRIITAYCPLPDLRLYARMRDGLTHKIPPIWERRERRIADAVVRLESVFPEYRSPNPTYWSTQHAHYQRRPPRSR